MIIRLYKGERERVIVRVCKRERGSVIVRLCKGQPGGIRVSSNRELVFRVLSNGVLVLNLGC